MVNYSSTLVLLLLNFFGHCTRAQEDGQAVDGGQTSESIPVQPRTTFIHPLTNMPGPSEDVETSFYFPGYTFLTTSSVLLFLTFHFHCSMYL